MMLSEKTICDCGEEIVATVEVLHYEVVECPRCGTDVYYEEWQYEEALSTAEAIALTKHSI